MGVVNGQGVNQSITNVAFINKNIDDDMPNKLGLTRPTSGDNIADIQAAANKLYACTGASESVTGTVYNSTPNTISNGDSHLVAFQKIASKFDAATGHRHTGMPGDAPAVSAGGISGVPLLGYVEKGTNISAGSGSSTDVTSLLTGKGVSTGPTEVGVPSTSPYNQVILQYGAGAVLGQDIIDSNGNKVYGRLTYFGSSWTLSYYSVIAGTELPYTFTAPVTLQWYYQELFNPLGSPPNYDQLLRIFGSNPTAAILSAGSNLFGKVALSATAATEVGTSGTLGTQNGYVANSDHVHRGVHSFAASGNSALYGDVILQAGQNILLSQVGNNILVTGTGVPVPLPVASGGTGLTSITAHRLIVGNGTGTPSQVAPATKGVVWYPFDNQDPQVTSSPILGAAGVSNGQLGFVDFTSGNQVNIQNPGTNAYNFNLPTTAGSAGQPLLSGGGGSNPQTYGILGLSFGGTGQSTKAAAFDALSPMAASGDIIYGGTLGTGTRLPKGADGDVLTLSSGLPAWLAPSAAAAPPGMIVMYGAASAPTGWLACDGSAVSRSTYAALFAIISTTYGVGDGSTTFNVPDTRGIFVRGAGSQTISGLTYTGTNGTKQVDTTKKNGLALSDPGHAHTLFSGPIGGTHPTINQNAANGPIYGPTSTDSSNVSLGGGDAETRPANIGLYFIIKT